MSSSKDDSYPLYMPPPALKRRSTDENACTSDGSCMSSGKSSRSCSRERVKSRLSKGQNYSRNFGSEKEINLIPTDSDPNTLDRTVFLVDDVRFIVDANLLRNHPNTMLGRMLTSPIAAKRNDHDEIELSVEVSSSVFQSVVEYYTHEIIYCPSNVSVHELKEACDYFMIPFNHHTVKSFNIRSLLHELSNDGASGRFVRFLEEDLLPLMVVAAKKGERECHIVVLKDDDDVDWDDDYPPSVPENDLNSSIIHSTAMYRFFKYIENREVAKRILKERGLKKIRIGIEGYATSKEKIKSRPGNRPEGRSFQYLAVTLTKVWQTCEDARYRSDLEERSFLTVIYNFAQRPFLRMSWEKEENKSRHVDFQFVSSKSASDLTNSLESAVVDLPAYLSHSVVLQPREEHLLPSSPHPQVGLPLLRNSTQIDQL